MHKTIKQILFLLSIPFISLYGIAQESNEKIWTQPEEIWPSYPGGEQEMRKFINERIVYTRAAIKAQAEGRVVTRFYISEKGEIGDIEIRKGIHPDCDSIAFNIIKSMPKWNPGTQAGKSVKCYFTLPIIFKLPNEEKIYQRCDTMPSFPGGTDSLYNFITKNLKYPVTGECFQGRVAVRFVVTKDGKIKNPEIIRSVAPTADKEALRVVSLMPDWIPAKHNGKNVNAYYHLPILFRLH